MKAMLTGIIAGAALAFAAQAQDESTNRVAVETAWSVFVEDEPTKECWSVSSPTQTVNTRGGEVVSVRRGQILLFVTFRPGASTGEVSFLGGYPFAEGSTVELNIGGTTFNMFVEGEYAWPASTAEDAQVIAAMKRGAEATLTGRSGRGTQTVDTFSLFGFTAALDEASSRCQS